MGWTSLHHKNLKLKKKKKKKVGTNMGLVFEMNGLKFTHI
jgi:hypothetical protein